MKCFVVFFCRKQKDFDVSKRICIIDGQGGGIGATLIKYLKEAYGESVVLIALGTNAIATAQMLKAGANKGASGESAICRTVFQVDCVLGPIAVTWANAILGEVTPKMAEAVTSSPALKILLPLSQESIEILGVVKEPLPHLVQEAVEKIKEVMKHV
jgi:NAD(P)-dependent dehydrogenase (short-subunit alcohol dehydrogenase family)